MNLNLSNDIITKSSYIQELFNGFEIEPHKKAIDTVRGIITQSALHKIKKQFNLQSPIYDHEAQAYQFKIDKAYLKVFSITAPQNAQALELCTAKRKTLTHFVYVELFGLSQYNALGQPIELSPKLQKLIHALINQDNLKRSYFKLQSVDYAIDFKDHNLKKSILPSKILDCIEQNQSLLKTRFSPNCYIQNNDKSNIAPFLSKVCIYDKSEKNRLTIENLVRVEFTINHDHNYSKEQSFKNYQLQDIFVSFDYFERVQDNESLERLKKRYPNAFKSYEAHKIQQAF